MRILTKKKQRDILLLIAANEIIAKSSVDINKKESIEAWTKMMENNANIAYDVAGVAGLQTVQAILEGKLVKEIQKEEK